MSVKEETYQDDLRYERAVWPEKFSMPETDIYVVLGERILLTLQGIDISLEKISRIEEISGRAPIERR